MNTQEKIIFDLVRESLNPDMIPESYKGLVEHPMFGHCHHASYGMYKLLGGKPAGYKLQRAKDDDGIIHYWLLSPSGEIIDPTVEQYTDLGRSLPYKNKVDDRASFRLTNSAKRVIQYVGERING